MLMIGTQVEYNTALRKIDTKTTTKNVYTWELNFYEYVKIKVLRCSISIEFIFN
jgi:hypothetical protein